MQHHPLRDQVYRASKAGYGPTAAINLGRASTYKLWTADKMDRAVAAVVSEGCAVRKAALQYGVPKSSLVGDRVSGRVTPGSVSGPPKYLSSDELGVGACVISVTMCHHWVREVTKGGVSTCPTDT